MAALSFPGYGLNACVIYGVGRHPLRLADVARHLRALTGCLDRRLASVFDSGRLRSVREIQLATEGV